MGACDDLSLRALEGHWQSAMTNQDEGHAVPGSADSGPCKIRVLRNRLAKHSILSPSDRNHNIQVTDQPRLVVATNVSMAGTFQRPTWYNYRSSTLGGLPVSLRGFHP